MSSVPNGMDRRHFLRHMAGFSLMAAPSLQFLNGLAYAQPQMKRDHKSLIVLWMGGGPSHMDTWDMKPGQPTGGSFKPMKTSADGVEICEHLPVTAKQMKHLSIVRSLVTNEGSHERGRTLMHTAYQPNPAVQFPSIGSVTSQQLTPKELAIPGFVSVSGTSEGPGFLGMAYAPFTVQNPGAPPQNISPPADLGKDYQLDERMKRRYLMFNELENGFIGQKRGEAAKAHADIYKKAFDLTYSPVKAVFSLDVDTNGRPMDAKLRDEYGRNGFGNGCLMARKLVEAGVPCVEVDLGGWDNHNGIFTALHNTNGQGRVDILDKGMGTLVRDLVDRGLWKNTVVVWMGEFGRTPRINQNGGRDHWARCWSVVVGGGGIKGGMVYGSTDKDGTSVKDNPASVGDLFATLYKAIGINPDHEIRDTLGQPRKIIGDKGGKPIEALL
jgi:hypothetical protein